MGGGQYDICSWPYSAESFSRKLSHLGSSVSFGEIYEKKNPLSLFFFLDVAI
jgi:hypothetical protein